MGHLVRLACLRHAASVHPEPGSNSQKYILFFVCYFPSYSNNLDVLLSFQRSFFPLIYKGFLRSFLSSAIKIYHIQISMSTTFFIFFNFFCFFLQKHVFCLFFIEKSLFLNDHFYLIYALN